MFYISISIHICFYIWHLAGRADAPCLIRHSVTHAFAAHRGRARGLCRPPVRVSKKSQTDPYMCMYMYMYVCMYVYIYIYILYIYIYIYCWSLRAAWRQLASRWPSSARMAHACLRNPLDKRPRLVSNSPLKTPDFSGVRIFPASG